VKVSFSKGSVRESGSCASLNRIASPLPFGLTAQRMQGCFVPISMQSPPAPPVAEAPPLVCTIRIFAKFGDKREY
jgi:hypothetical protein